MCDITNEVTMRLGLGQRVLEDSREWVIRGLIVQEVPSDLRHLGPRSKSLALLSLSCFRPPAKHLFYHVLVIQQLCFLSSHCSDCQGSFHQLLIAG